jgi:hypothetical protein
VALGHARAIHYRDMRVVKLLPALVLVLAAPANPLTERAAIAQAPPAAPSPPPAGVQPVVSSFIRFP